MGWEQGKEERRPVVELGERCKTGNWEARMPTSILFPALPLPEQGDWLWEWQNSLAAKQRREEGWHQGGGMKVSLPYLPHLYHLVLETWGQAGADAMWRAPLWASQPVHKSRLATYSLCGLRLGTASVFSFLIMKRRQDTFLAWFWRSNTSKVTLYLPSLLFLSPLENPHWCEGQKTDPHNRKTCGWNIRGCVCFLRGGQRLHWRESPI